MAKKILITGGAGFLGANLCEKLLKDGHEVTVLDNLYTGSKKNLDGLFSNNNFNFIHDDVRNPLIFDNNYSEIYNLACPASPIHYQNTPLKTMQTSVYGAFNILDFAKKNNSKVLQASTSEVYGNPHVNPQSEKYFGNVNPIGVRSCYDEGKRAAESIFFDFHRTFNQKIKVVRIFNTYGPKMSLNDGRVVSNFIIQALSNKPLTIYGDGSQTRSFCYVSDMIRGFVKMMHSSDCLIGPINLGTTYEFTMIGLAELILKLTKSKSKISFRPLPKDDPIQRKPDLSLAKKKLDWEPEVEIDEGLKITIEYFKKELQG